MNKIQEYVECQNCGTIHYIITESERRSFLSGPDVNVEELSNRNIEYCSTCGCKTKFVEVTEEYANEFLNGENVPPLIYPSAK